MFTSSSAQKIYQFSPLGIPLLLLISAVTYVCMYRVLLECLDTHNHKRSTQHFDYSRLSAIRAQIFAWQIIVLDPLLDLRWHIGFQFHARLTILGHIQICCGHRTIVQGHCWAHRVVRCLQLHTFRCQKIIHHLFRWAIDDALPTNCNGVHELIGGPHETMLHVNGLIVPVDDLQRRSR